jgi:RNA recognition motif-containing protein
MGKRQYVGNMPYSATDAVLVDTFTQCGTVTSATVITDRDSGRSKGFAFVEMSTETEALNAISKFHGMDWEGRPLTVTEAKPRPPRESNSGDRW